MSKKVRDPPKLIKCVNQLNTVPIHDQTTLIALPRRTASFFDFIESEITLEVKPTDSDQLRYIYSETTKNALELATCVYFYLKKVLEICSPKQIVEKVHRIEDTLLYFHTKLQEISSSIPKPSMTVSSTKEDVILCYSTSLLYRLGQFVIPRTEVFQTRTSGRDDEGISTYHVKPDNTTGSASQATYQSRSNTLNRRNKKFGAQRKFAERNKKDLEDDKATTGIALLNTVAEAAKKETTKEETSTPDLHFLNMLKKRVGSRQSGPVSILKEDLLEFDKNNHELEVIFTNICTNLRVQHGGLYKKKITKEDYERADI